MYKSDFEFLYLNSINHLLEHKTVFVVNYNRTIFLLKVVRASPQLDLVVCQNGHAINFLWVDDYAWRDTHFFYSKSGDVLLIVEGLNHEIIKTAYIWNLVSSQGENVLLIAHKRHENILNL